MRRFEVTAQRPRLRLGRPVLPAFLGILTLAGAINFTSIDFGIRYVAEGALVAFLVLQSSLKKKFVLTSSALLLIVLVEFAIALVLQGDKFYWGDFVLAIKPFAYLALLALVRPSPIINRQKFVSDCIFLLFLTAYILSFITHGARPYLLSENNFEIPFLILLWTALVVNGHSRLIGSELFVLVAIVALSLSRSGVAELAGTLCLMFFRRAGRQEGSMFGSVSMAKVVRYIWLIPFLVFAIYVVFLLRGSGNGIDRVYFAESFWSAFSEFSPINVIFGKGALSELPLAACNDLQFYLESLAGKHGQCFSVAWHAATFRLLHDFGIAGFVGAYFVLYKILRRRYSPYDSMCAICPVFLAGLSVGGIYNFLSILGIFVFYISGHGKLDALHSRPALTWQDIRRNSFPAVRQ